MFTTELRLEAERENDLWELLEDLVWSENGAPRFTVPAGFMTDLASIPRPLRGLLSQNGCSRRPAVLHDWLYSIKPITRTEADALFLIALRSEGLGWPRYLYHIGVRLGGWLAWRR